MIFTFFYVISTKILRPSQFPHLKIVEISLPYVKSILYQNKTFNGDLRSVSSATFEYNISNQNHALLFFLIYTPQTGDKISYFIRIRMIQFFQCKAVHEPAYTTFFFSSDFVTHARSFEITSRTVSQKLRQR